MPTCRRTGLCGRRRSTVGAARRASCSPASPSPRAAARAPGLGDGRRARIGIGGSNRRVGRGLVSVLQCRDGGDRRSAPVTRIADAARGAARRAGRRGVGGDLLASPAYRGCRAGHRRDVPEHIRAHHDLLCAVLRPASPQRARRDPHPHAGRLRRGGPQRQGGRRGARDPRQHTAHHRLGRIVERTGRDLRRLSDVIAIRITDGRRDDGPAGGVRQRRRPAHPRRAPRRGPASAARHRDRGAPGHMGAVRRPRRPSRACRLRPAGRSQRRPASRASTCSAARSAAGLPRSSRSAPERVRRRLMLPNARLHVVKGGGHLFLPRPARERRGVVRDFLDAP